MSSAEHSLGPPHFHLKARDRVHGDAFPPVRPAEGEHSAGQSGEVAALLMRGAECLETALLECTADAGLNEARYRVLDALHRHTGGECSQAELAVKLLHSESNLSTLLDRMGGDGLITRARSQTDRRRSLIRLAPAGLEALELADQARATTTARLFRFLSSHETDQLVELLQRLVGDLENSPEVCARRATGVDSPVNGLRSARPSRGALTTAGAPRNDSP